MNVFINGVSSKIGGGKNILDNYITTLREKDTKNTYYFLTPSLKEYSKYEDENIKIIDVPSLFKSGALFFILYFISLPIILRKYKIDIIINFADVIIPTKIKQIYFFDWAYAVFDEKYIWDGMKLKDLTIRKIKIFLIAKYISKTSIVLCQTETIKKRLNERYNIRKLIVELTPVSFLNSNITTSFKINDSRIKLFYPANDSTHKNHKFIIKFLQRIEDLKLPYVVITTLDFEAFNKIYVNIEVSLKSHLINLGKIKLEDMPSVYKEIDYLFFPSLLETYGIPYIEAMYFEKPILTSDLDFANDLCGDAAIYFNPFEPDSAIEQLNKLKNNIQLQRNMFIAGKEKLQQIPTWTETIAMYENLIENI